MNENLLHEFVSLVVSECCNSRPATTADIAQVFSAVSMAGKGVYDEQGEEVDINIVLIVKDKIKELVDSAVRGVPCSVRDIDKFGIFLSEIKASTASHTSDQIFQAIHDQYLSSSGFERVVCQAINNSLTTVPGKRSKKDVASPSVLRQAFYSFNFDDLPDYEPLELTLQVLRTNPCDKDALKKLLNMDAGELAEHPQWDELLKLLRAAMIQASDPADIGTIAYVFLKYIEYFDDNNQGVDASLSFIVCLLLAWGGGVIDSNAAPAPSYTPSYCCFVNSSSSQIIELYQFVLSINVYQILFGTLITLLSKLSHRKLGSYSSKVVDELIIGIFALLCHGSIDVNFDESAHKLSIIDLLLFIDSQTLCAFFDSLGAGWHACSILGHALSIGLLQSIQLKSVKLFHCYRDLLVNYKLVESRIGSSQEPGTEAELVFLEQQLAWCMKRCLASIILFFDMISVHIADSSVRSIVASLTQQVVHNKNQSFEPIAITVSPIPSYNKKLFSLSTLASTDGLPKSSISSYLTNIGLGRENCGEDIEGYVCDVAVFLGDDIMSVFVVVTSDAAACELWLKAVSVAMKGMSQSPHDTLARLSLCHSIVDAYRAITGIAAQSFVDSRVLRALDLLLVSVVCNFQDLSAPSAQSALSTATELALAHPRLCEWLDVCDGELDANALALMGELWSCWRNAFKIEALLSSSSFQALLSTSLQIYLSVDACPEPSSSAITTCVKSVVFIIESAPMIAPYNVEDSSLTADLLSALVSIFLDVAVDSVSRSDEALEEGSSDTANASLKWPRFLSVECLDSMVAGVNALVMSVDSEGLREAIDEDVCSRMRLLVEALRRHPSISWELCDGGESITRALAELVKVLGKYPEASQLRAIAQAIWDGKN